MKNAWGTVPNNSEEAGDNYRVTPHGALSSKTKNTGDGFWCPICFKQGKFVWINPDKKHPYCGTCKTPRSEMDDAEITKIMKSH